MTKIAQLTLTIIGCGNVGKVLGKLWHAQQSLILADILNRSPESARRAADFIGTGRVAVGYADLRAADVFLIAAPDDQIMLCCRQLAASGRLSNDSIVFHCSGALASSVLRPAQALGAAVASVHPVRSFAVPEQVVQSFAGTWCGIEGDPRALAVLAEVFSAVGASLAPVNPDCKMLYHSAAVFASNYLVTVLDVALQAYEKAGIPNHIALKIIEPLVRNTADNVFKNGTEKALSGPVARGDRATAIKQYQAVKTWNKRHGELYKQLGRLTASLAARAQEEKVKAGGQDSNALQHDLPPG